MKKNLLCIVVVVAIVAVAGYNVYISQSEKLSALVLANVEALADPEVDIPYICVGEEKACYDPYYHEVFEGYRWR